MHAFLPAGPLPETGTARLVLAAAIVHAGRVHDLELEWRRRDGIWDRECLGHLPRLVSSLHEFEIAVEPDDGAVRLRGRIDPDFWCAVHGRFEAVLRGDAYEGRFGDAAVAGAVRATFLEAPQASRGAVAFDSALLREFRSTGGRGRLYDFARVGRGTALEVPDLPRFPATDFGVQPDSGRECLPALQAAIDAAGMAGGGIVQLPAGVLDANVERKLPPLRIRHPRVYLVGAGSGPGGTLLVNHRYSDTPDPSKPWRAGEHPLLVIGDDAAPGAGELVPLATVTEGARGSPEIRVADPRGLRIGDTVLLRQREAADGSLGRDLVFGQVEVGANWRGEGKTLVTQLARIVALDGPVVRLDAPLHRSIGRWRAELCAAPLLDGGGIAHVRLAGHWGGYFVHHKNGEHDNGWDQVRFSRVAGGLVRDVVHESTTSALGFKDCLGCVAVDCTILGNPGHNGFVLGGMSTGNLFLRCHGGRNMHGFNLAGTIAGNAIVDCSLDEPSGIDLHGGVGVDTLVDSLSGGVLQGGGSPSALPPRHGPGLVLWNWRAGHYNPYKVWQRLDLFPSAKLTPGYVAVGLHGAYGHLPLLGTPAGPVAADLDEPWGVAESHGQRVLPRSLLAWMREGAT